MTTFCSEILQQPASLRRLVNYYQFKASGYLDRILAPSSLVLTGMGASLHAAQVAAYHLQSHNQPAIAIEAADLFQYGLPILNRTSELLYISQSGQSAEVAEMLQLGEELNQKVFVAVTNDLSSLLARSAQFALPLAVDEETLVATQTYTNSLALLWLLVHHWVRSLTSKDFLALLRLADSMEAMLERSNEIADYWLEYFSGVDTLVFTGFGLHSATARQSAQTVAEWVKAPVLGISAGALRHGFIEIIDSKIGVVVFTGHDRTWDLASRLAQELSTYGATTMISESGHFFQYPNHLAKHAIYDEFLSPILDLIPVQLYAEALASKLGVQPGFRYLKKIVEKI